MVDPGRTADLAGGEGHDKLKFVGHGVVMKEEQIIVGGQAVIEGVMMRAPHSYAVAVRRPDGQIVSKGERLPALGDKYPLLKLPVLRGSAVLIQSMILGIKALNFSANIAFDEMLKNPEAAS